MPRLLLLLLSIAALASCDPGYNVIVINRSNNERRIKIIEANKYRLEGLDSIWLRDTSSNWDTGSARIMEKDTGSNSYSFLLPKGTIATIQAGNGWPDFRQKVILDGNDTILLNKDKRCAIRRRPMMTNVVVRID